MKMTDTVPACKVKIGSAYQPRQRYRADADMERLQRALLSDHRLARMQAQDRRSSVAVDIACVILAPVVMGLVLFSGEIAAWLGVA